MNSPPTVVLVAGEASGDQLGAALIRQLRQRKPELRFAGIGGAAMRDAGMETWWDCEELAVFGLFEVVAHFPRLLKIRRALQRRITQLAPRAFIGIDAPDFNLGLEIKLRQSGIPTVHYVSPTVWAWRPGRVKKIARACDLVLCLFPFEPDFYREHGVEACYVGHPMADQIPMHSDGNAARAALGLAADRPVIALLPGSRVGEVSRLAAPMLDAVRRLQVIFPQAQFVTALAGPRVREVFETALKELPANTVLAVDGQARRVMAAADVVLCASGTATLETLLINRPMVTAYRLAPSTYRLAKHLKLIRMQHFSLPNILASRTLVPELIQDEANGQRLAEETAKWLQDEAARKQLTVEFERLHKQLQCHASDRAAQAVAALLERSA